MSELKAGLTRRGAFGAAAVIAAPPLAASPVATAAVDAAPHAVPLAFRVGAAEVDRMQGIIGLVIHKPRDGEAPNVWAAFGEPEKRYGSGRVFDNERSARFTAIEDWDVYRTIKYEAGNLKKLIAAKQVLAENYDGEMVCISDDHVEHVDDARDYLADDDRSWAHAAEAEEFSYDVEEALDNHLADWFEDADSRIPESDRAQLRALWRDIEKRNAPSLTRYSEDTKTVVIYDAAAFGSELAGWVQRLALCEAAIARIDLEGVSAVHLLYVTDCVARIAKGLLRDNRRF
jgi:hypothetical protein